LFSELVEEPNTDAAQRLGLDQILEGVHCVLATANRRR
jgi:hypothetical protein